MRFWKLSSLPDLDDMAPAPLKKRPPRPELGLGATFLGATFLAAPFVGAALALGAATFLALAAVKAPNMAGSAERTAVRITTAEAGATKASVLWRQKRPGERKTCVRYNTEACMRRTDRRAYWCFTAAAPRYTSIHNKMQRKCSAKACGGAVGRVGHMGAHHARNATRAKILYIMIELRKGGRVVSQVRADMAAACVTHGERFGGAFEVSSTTIRFRPPSRTAWGREFNGHGFGLPDLVS